jgi:transposase
MRGSDTFTESLFTLRKLEDFVPSDHPLRPIRVMVNAALLKMDALFSGMYEADIKGGRPSIAPEKLLRAMLLQVFYSIRSERQLMEQAQYNLLFRWFIGLAMDDGVWVPTVFTKNRERLIKHDAVIELFNLVLEQAQARDLLSGEHFSVDGTLIQAWAGHKSFVAKDAGDADKAGGDDGPTGKADTTDFHGEKRSNATHESSTDADARLYCKGDNASRLRYMGHTLCDNRHGLIANAMVTTADGYAEREAAKAMIKDAVQAASNPEAAITLGADKGYDAKEFIEALQDIKVIPHVAQNTSGRRSAVPDVIAASTGYAISIQKRKLIEQGFGWAKTVGRIRQVMVRGLKRVDQVFVLTMAAYNLTRMRTLGQMRPKTA